MPQFNPDYIKIPKEIKEDPEKFGLTKSELYEVECCNSIAKAPRMNSMLTDEQWETYWKAVKTIKRFEHELIFERLVAKEKDERLKGFEA